MSYTKTELQKLLTKTEAYLESSIRGLNITGIAVTEDNFLVLTFIYGQELEDGIFLNPDWIQLKFPKLMQLLLFKIVQQEPRSPSQKVH